MFKILINPNKLQRSIRIIEQQVRCFHISAWNKNDLKQNVSFKVLRSQDNQSRLKAGAYAYDKKRCLRANAKREALPDLDLKKPSGWDTIGDWKQLLRLGGVSDTTECHHQFAGDHCGWDTVGDWKQLLSVGGVSDTTTHHFRAWDEVMHASEEDSFWISDIPYRDIMNKDQEYWP